MIIAIIVLGVLLLMSTTAAVVFGIMWKRTFNEKKKLYQKIHRILKESQNCNLGD
jgi:hypothetical protein